MSSLVIYGKGKVMGALRALLDHLQISYLQMDDTDANIEVLQTAQYIIATPGIKPSHRLYQDFGTKIVGELSYIASLRQQGYFPRWKDHLKIIGITGTNGKSTTTWLTYHALSQLFAEQDDTVIWMGGNFDQPLSGILMEIEQKSLTHQQHRIVLEVSSFMLWHLQGFHFDIGVFLNFARDHLDRHHDMNDYFAAKAEILFTADKAITSPVLISAFEEFTYRKKPTGRKTWLLLWMKQHATYLFERRAKHDSSLIVYEPFLSKNPYFVGKHNEQNMGAVHSILTTLLGSYDTTVLDRIPLIPHRKQYIGDIDGIRIIDDAISTSMHALHAALNAMTEKVVLLSGGYDKGNDYNIITTLLVERVGYLVCYGAVGAQLYALAMQNGIPSTLVNGLEEGVLVALTMAKKCHLTTFLYSPGAASFDLFDNVYQRIRTFEDIIEKIKTGELVYEDPENSQKLTEKKSYYNGMLANFLPHQAVEEEKFAELNMLYDLPKDYMDFMLMHNGGDGMVGKTHLTLYTLDELVQHNQKTALSKKLPGIFLIGCAEDKSFFGLDMRTPKVSYVMLTPSLAEEELTVLGTSMKSFFEKLCEEK